MLPDTPALPRQPMSGTERELVSHHLDRTRLSFRNALKLLPWAAGLAGIGAVCVISAWQAGPVGKVLYTAFAAFFLWPVPSVFRASPRVARLLQADLGGGEVVAHAGTVARRYFTRGRHGHARLVLDSGADFAIPVPMAQAMTEDEPITLRVAPASGCLLSVVWRGETHAMPQVLDGAPSLH